MLKLTKIILVVALIFGALLVLPAETVETVFASTPAQDIQDGVDAAAGGANTTNPETTLQQTITGVVNILTIIVGAAATIMALYGGYLYITSAGEPGKVATAKRAFMYALVGIIVAALAQSVTRFLIYWFNR